MYESQMGLAHGGHVMNHDVFALVEPASINFRLLKLNTAANAVPALLLRTGVRYKAARLYYDCSFRDGQNGFIALTEVHIGHVDAVNFNDIVAQHGIMTIDLLKTDIEGGERYLFNEKREELEFLATTRIIAIETHEDYRFEDHILAILREAGFNISHRNEYLVDVREGATLPATITS